MESRYDVTVKSTKGKVMSATRTSLLTIAALIASTSLGATQESGAPADIAKVPGTGAYVLQDIELGRRALLLPGAPNAIVETFGLSENSFDFGNPDSIPGFGTLSKEYDTRRVRPRFSGE